MFSLVEFLNYFIPFLTVSNLPFWRFWSRGTEFTGQAQSYFLFTFWISTILPLVIFSDKTYNSLCFPENVSCFFNLSCLPLVCVTSVISGLAHSLHVYQVKQRLSIVVCCWDEQYGFLTLSHPGVLFLRCQSQWAEGLYHRRLLTCELQRHQQWRLEKEYLCDLFISVGSNRKLGGATAFCPYCSIAIPILTRKISFPFASQPLSASLSLLFPVRHCSFWGTPASWLCLSVWIFLLVQANTSVYTCDSQLSAPSLHGWSR